MLSHSLFTHLRVLCTPLVPWGLSLLILCAFLYTVINPAFYPVLYLIWVLFDRDQKNWGNSMPFILAPRPAQVMQLCTHPELWVPYTSICCLPAQLCCPSAPVFCFLSLTSLGLTWISQPSYQPKFISSTEHCLLLWPSLHSGMCSLHTSTDRTSFSLLPLNWNQVVTLIKYQH